MRDSGSTFARRPRFRALALLLLGALLSAVGAVLPSVASAAGTNPVRIVVDQVTSDVHAPADTPAGAVPYVLVQAGGTFHVRVSFYDASGAPAAFSKDTTLTIASNHGTLSRTTGLAPRNATTATLDSSLLQATNQVELTVSVAGRTSRTVTAGTSSPAQRFDVVKELRFAGAAPSVSFSQGIGGDDSSCQNATTTNPVCGVLTLPHGARSSQVLLSLGACDATYAACGSTQGSVVQALGDLEGLYSNTDPATLLMKCDKSLCGGGAIRNQHLSFSLGGNDALGTAAPCPAKGTVGVGQDACVDYVQSQRDGSGDTLLYLLFTRDMRGSVG